LLIKWTGSALQYTLGTIKSRLGANAIPMQLPIGSESNFKGMIDLMTMQAIYFEDELGKEPKYSSIPLELQTQAEEMRGQMIEKIAELDDDLTVKYLEGETISNEELKVTLRKAVLNAKATPVFCGSSLKNKGVQLVLDAVIDYLPSPIDIVPVKVTNLNTDEEISLPTDDNAPLSALVFKIVSDPYVGRLAYFRVYSGTLATGAMVYNPLKGRKERVGRLLRMYADRREDITEVPAGDIGAILGLKDSFTGDTLCDASTPIVLERITFPEPVIFIAIEPKSAADQDKMAIALQRLSEEDPTFRVHTDENTGQTIIAGMGELHLDVLVDRMLREFKVQANVGRPRVSYRETITRAVPSIGYKYVKQSGGHGQYGHVVFAFEPLERGSGIKFENKISGGSIPKEYIPAVEKGVREATESGVLSGYPVTDLKVQLIDGSFHEVDSSEMAFKMAAIMCFREGLHKGLSVLLEPIMKVEVVVAEEYLGEILGQVSSRRGEILGMDMRPGNAQAVRATVPLAEMFGYATELRSGTQGRGVFTMEFDHYAPVSATVAEKVINK
jgi:elongation factor G